MCVCVCVCVCVLLVTPGMVRSLESFSHAGKRTEILPSISCFEEDRKTHIDPGNSGDSREHYLKTGLFVCSWTSCNRECEELRYFGS